MNEDTNKNTSRSASRILLVLALLILLGVGGYSLYRIFLNRPAQENNNIAVALPTTTNEPTVSSNILQNPTIAASVFPTQTSSIIPSPTFTPTAIPLTPTNTLTPTRTISSTPTSTPKPTSTTTPTNVQNVNPTNTPSQDLPASGNSLPTILTLILGIILIIPALFI